MYNRGTGGRTPFSVTATRRHTQAVEATAQFLVPVSPSQKGNARLIEHCLQTGRRRLEWIFLRSVMRIILPRNIAAEHPEELVAQ